QLLDQPGEWYLNRATDVLSYLPRSGEDMTTATVVVPILETLISGTGMTNNPISNIQFKGLTFAYATWNQPSSGEGFVEVQAGWIWRGSTPVIGFAPANLVFHTAHDIRFERNTFTHLGAQGLAFDQGSQNNTIIGNVFTDISGTAVRIGTVDAPNAPSHAQELGNTVSNNYIHDIAVEYHGGVGLMGGYTANTTFAHNEIADVPYSGISLGWGWGVTSYAQNNEIANNLIHDHVQLLVDGGGIYTLSEQAAPDGSQRTRVHDNYMYNQGNEYGSLYPDEASAYMDWYNNVVANTPRWLHIWTPSINNLYVHDNFSDTTTATTNGTNITYANNYTSGTPWPSAAQAIINGAGLQAAYQDIKPTSATNLALNKSASASTEYSPQCAAAKANNGSTDASDSCGGWSPSGGDANPWWQVDLGSAYRITALELVTRQNCCDNPSTRQGFDLQASNDPSFATYTVLGNQETSPLPYQATWSATVDDPTAYRYVRATKAGYFFIAEVRVFGTASAPTNVALNKSAVASSQYVGPYAPSNAVNGTTSNDDGWSPSGTDVRPWLQVDLGQAYQLSKIEFVSRQGCCDQPEARRSFEIWASNNADMALGHVVLGGVDSSGIANRSTWELTLSDTTAYRYVAAVKTVDEYFFISELRVFGTP
ncbi:MAG: discoidin domain-containing protein, partial [Roseiflexaceae bacterium]|nr:discoidin domain-containing protein [Roseiflexaceae bacterium]